MVVPGHIHMFCFYLRNKFNLWIVHGIMNTSGLLQSMWGFTMTLQETLYVHASMNRPKIEFITFIYILYYQSSINFHPTWLVFRIFSIKSAITEVSEQPKHQISPLNVMVMRFQQHTNVSIQCYWMALTLVHPNGTYVGVA